MDINTLPPGTLAVDPTTAGKIIGSPECTLRSWRSRGTNGPPFVRISKTKVVYLVADLREWLEARRVIPAHMQIARELKPWEKRTAT